MLNEALESCKKMVSADKKTDVKREIKQLIACILQLLTEVSSQNLKYNVK